MQEQNNFPQDVLLEIPDQLPAPEDDGACDHLAGLSLPSANLPSTAGAPVNLAHLAGWVVIYCYPMTGRPGRAIPDGWISIPGAAGCTPQACSFRDSHADLTALGARVFGISSQTTEDQIEAARRLHLPYELLSDRMHQFSQALNLPIFEVDGMRLLKRVTLIARDGKIVKYFYPVFPPDQNVNHVLACLRRHAA